MSLVTEALRKARQEAAAKEAARHGKPVSIQAARPPRGPLDVPKLLVIAALALGAALAGAGILRWILERETPGAGPVAAGTPTPVPQLPATGPVASTGTVASVPDARVEAAAPPPKAGAASREPGPAPGRQETPAAAGAPAPPETTPSGAPPETAPAPAGAPTRERVFVLDADLGRVKLHLDFLVYKPSAPFASINGRQVVPGSIVDGLVVDEIGRDFVRLSDRHGTIVLRVR